MKVITLASHKGTYNAPFPSSLCLCFITSLPANPSYEFDLHEREPVGGTLFDMNDFGRRLVLTKSKRQLGSGLSSGPIKTRGMKYINI